MKCVESYSFSLMNVMAGFLPGAAQSVAALLRDVYGAPRAPRSCAAQI